MRSRSETKPGQRRLGGKRRFTERAVLLALSVSAVALFTAPATAAAAQPGAIFTQEDGCARNGDVTHFHNKQDVYVKGSNLTPGDYYLQVSSPGQPGPIGTVLGKSATANVHVGSNGVLNCTNVWDNVQSATLNPGYDDTDNPGGVYQVNISTGSTFDPSTDPKSKNFMVGGDVPPQHLVKVQKFYDKNTNGVDDGPANGEPLISGWEVKAENGTDTFSDVTTWNNFLGEGPWTITENTPTQSNWYPTTDPSFNINVPDDSLVEFGNVCTGAGGGLTLGFWSNKNGQALVGAGDLTMLQDLNLVRANGYAFDPPGYSQLRTWLLNATATNMAYMLSAQLAAMELNVLNGKVSGDSLIYAPGTNSANAAGFATVTNVMAEANTAIGAHSLTLDGSPYRAYQETLKNALDKANNNLNFVQGSPANCPFTFDPSFLS